ncbi:MULTISPECIES: methyl-accepting chemotaxis protein [unclassified Vibrio]|uniref:Methyl-accepting chemotaxis protein n=1 Tax=Vibrio sp. HB236076 TaxID=3232307 RepID=A0AB39HBP6_9VIBR|nr:methyl-accepting chemotaxis protein [Vibrio sp. HB161653]MDP5255578.1 methyl-accepting chemotaxis protein [Vibrio sp. HB161653]
MTLKRKLFLICFSAVLFIGGALILTVYILTSSLKQTTLDDFHHAYLSDRQDKLQGLVDTAYTAILPNVTQLQGEALKQSLAQTIGALRFETGNPDSYFYIHNSQGIVIAHGANPNAVGTSQWDLKNDKDQYIVRNIVNSATKGDGFTVFDGYRPSEKAYFPKMTYSRYLPAQDLILTTGFYIDDVDQLTEQEASMLSQHYDQVLLVMTLITVLSAALVVAMGGFLINRNLKPLEMLNQQLDVLAHGSGDLTVRLDTNGNDEIAMSADAFNRFMAKLHELITSITAMTGELQTSSHQVTALNQTSKERITVQLDQVRAVATAIDEMTQANNQVAQETQRTSELAIECAQLTDKSIHTAQVAQQSMSNLGEEAQHAELSVNELNISTQKISQIVDTIQNIAEQTNLLALNAAIEAARAGEQGRGFAVVADEVRSLASKTAQSSNEVLNLIHQLQATTKTTTLSIQSMNKLVSQTGEEISQVSGNMAHIGDAIATLQNLAAQIANATKEQSQVSHDVAQSIHQVNTIADELTDNASIQVTEITQQNAKVDQVHQRLSQFKV